MPNEKDAEIKSRYEDYSVEELRAALDSIFDSTDEFSDSDVEQMDEIMAVLDKKDPLSQRYTAEESWKHFQENYREELSRLGVRYTEEVGEKESEDTEKTVGNDSAGVTPVNNVSQMVPRPSKSEAKHGKCCRKLLHIALIAAAVVTAMVIITVSAAAAGIDIWGWVPVFNSGTFQFASEDYISQDIPYALKQAGIEEPMFPTWLPEDYLLEEQQIRLDDPLTVNAVFSAKNHILTITIKKIVDLSQTGLTEANDGDYTNYIQHGIQHTIFSNNRMIVATWHVEDYLIRISGTISVEDMKKIIDSIYDTR